MLLKKYKVLDVINVCFYCCLILLFVLTCFLNNGWSHQSDAAFFTPLNCLQWRQCFCSYTYFWKFFGSFCLFLIWLTLMPKKWMIGVVTLCANTHYRASFFVFWLTLCYIALSMIWFNFQAKISGNAMLFSIFFKLRWFFWKAKLFVNRQVLWVLIQAFSNGDLDRMDASSFRKKMQCQFQKLRTYPSRFRMVILQDSGRFCQNLARLCIILQDFCQNLAR